MADPMGYGSGGGYGSQCRPQHSPSDGGYEAGSIEADGMPGPKDVGLAPTLGVPLNGNFNEAQMDAFTGRGASGPPDNMANQYMEPGNPTAAEGALPVEEYPRMKPRY